MHNLRLVLIGIAVGLLAILGWRLVGSDVSLGPQAPVATPGEAPQPTLTSASLSSARARIEALIAGVPEYTVFFANLKQNFPADHQRAMEGFSERAARAGNLESADYYLSEALRIVRQSHGVLAAKADGPPIERVFELQAAVVRALEAIDPRACVDFLYGGANPAFYRFSAENRTLIAAFAQASLDAMVNGRVLRVDRAAPGDADFAALEQALVKGGLGSAEIEALLDGKTPDPPLADATMCRAGRVYYEALRSLPGDVRLKIYALAIQLLARS